MWQDNLQPSWETVTFIGYFWVHPVKEAALRYDTPKRWFQARLYPDYLSLSSTFIAGKLEVPLLHFLSLNHLNISHVWHNVRWETKPEWLNVQGTRKHPLWNISQLSAAFITSGGGASFGVCTSDTDKSVHKNPWKKPSANTSRLPRHLKKPFRFSALRRITQDVRRSCERAAVFIGLYGSGWCLTWRRVRPSVNTRGPEAARCVFGACLCWRHDSRRAEPLAGCCLFPPVF